MKNIFLRPMREVEFNHWMERSIKHYAGEKVRAGTWKRPDALELAKKSFRKLLPKGIETTDHHIFAICDETVKMEMVGTIWLGLRKNEKGEREGYIWDFEIHTPFRRKGYGKAAMQLAVDKVKKFGAKQLLLHVFGHNEPARSLYEGIGFTPVGITMSKRL